MESGNRTSGYWFSGYFNNKFCVGWISANFDTLID